MEKIDPQKAARVWQRVQGSGGPDMALLQQVLLEERMTGGGWRALSRNLPGQRELLQQLYRQSRERCDCLRGICVLVTGTAPEAVQLPLKQESVQGLLRAGYRQLIRCLARYEAWQTEGEYGPVFVRLAEQTREHCRCALQLLGGL